MAHCSSTYEFHVLLYCIMCTCDSKSVREVVITTSKGDYRPGTYYTLTFFRIFQDYYSPERNRFTLMSSSTKLPSVF